MRIKQRKTRVAAAGKRHPLNVGASELAGTVPSFQAEIAKVERAKSGGGGIVVALAASRRVELTAWQQTIADAMRRAWEFLHAKYKTSTTKRLRVSETISLGEKRFVAIVAVEGREFLIGGGVSGMSLLAQLGAAGAVTTELGQKLVDGGGAL